MHTFKTLTNHGGDKHPHNSSRLHENYMQQRSFNTSHIGSQGEVGVRVAHQCTTTHCCRTYNNTQR